MQLLKCRSKQLIYKVLKQTKQTTGITFLLDLAKVTSAYVFYQDENAVVPSLVNWLCAFMVKVWPIL